MRQASYLFASLLMLLTASSASADDIVRWVDAEGVTHFGNRMFAPPEHSTVTVEPTNGMVPAYYNSQQPRRNGPAVVNLSRPRVENQRGFRGYASRPRRGSSRRR